jgi:hypothetical protein
MLPSKRLKNKLSVLNYGKIDEFMLVRLYNTVTKIGLPSILLKIGL